MESMESMDWGMESMESMEWRWNPWNNSIWNEPWIGVNMGGFHHHSMWNSPRFHVEYDHSMTIPYGIHGDHGTRKWLGPHPKVIPYGMGGGMGGGIHGIHMD